MTNLLRMIFLSGAVLSVLASTTAARAQDNPCGKFDFTSGLDCRIDIEGGCEVQCRPLNFEVACSGGCDVQATTTCTGECEALCNSQCNPAQLDCMAGCDMECGSKCNAACTLDDCIDECGASCNANCAASCTGQATDCQSTCKECCHGACTTEVNINCDVACYADLEGGCKAQCQAPTGALFCNGQYVAASDVNACIVWLAQNGVQVNAEARGEVTCNLSGCEGASSAFAGCAVGPSSSLAAGASGMALVACGLGAAMARRRRSRR